MCDVSFCFSRRFEWGVNKTDDTVTCDDVKLSRLQARGPCLDNDVCSNITKIADKLAGLSNAVGSSAGSAAQQGLSAVGCAAQQAFQQTAAYYFNSKLKSTHHQLYNPAPFVIIAG